MNLVDVKKEIENYRKQLADHDDLKKKVDAYEKFYGIKK